MIIRICAKNALYAKIMNEINTGRIKINGKETNLVSKRVRLGRVNDRPSGHRQGQGG